MYEFKINERFQELRNHLGLTRDEFARKTCIGGSTLVQIEHKKQKVNGEHLELICESYPEFAYWIATGKVKPEVGFTSPELETMHRDLKKGAA